MRKKSVGKSFRKINLAHTDDFAQKNDKIRLWVINNGGTFSKELNNEVTHLVCSKKAWKAYPDVDEFHIDLPRSRWLTQGRTVRDARSQRIKVVSLEWLEDSLLSPSRRPKSEKEYEWDTISKREHEKKQAVEIRKDNAIKETSLSHDPSHAFATDKKVVAKFEKQVIDFEATLQTQGFHPYADPDGFCYSVLLVRTFLLENRLEKLTLKVRYPLQPSDSWPPTSLHPCSLPMYLFPASSGLSLHPVVRYQDRFPPSLRLRVPIPRPWAQCLQLFESDAIPHTYACYVKYTRKGASGREILAIPGSSWELAFDAFRKFFKTKTRKDWNERLDGKPAPISNDGSSDDPFRYEPPKGAREPKGLVEQKTRLERAKKDPTGHDDSVTMIVPTIEISDDDDGGSRLNVQACTSPELEW